MASRVRPPAGERLPAGGAAIPRADIDTDTDIDPEP
jgi:hypothetical protein